MPRRAPRNLPLSPIFSAFVRVASRCAATRACRIAKLSFASASSSSSAALTARVCGNCEPRRVGAYLEVGSALSPAIVAARCRNLRGGEGCELGLPNFGEAEPPRPVRMSTAFADALVVRVDDERTPSGAARGVGSPALCCMPASSDCRCRILPMLRARASSCSWRCTSSRAAAAPPARLSPSAGRAVCGLRGAGRTAWLMLQSRRSSC